MNYEKYQIAGVRWRDDKGKKNDIVIEILSNGSYRMTGKVIKAYKGYGWKMGDHVEIIFSKRNYYVYQPSRDTFPEYYL